jgi:hypothetical protein
MAVFRQHLATPGNMVCLDQAMVQKHKVALRDLAERGLMLKERFEGGYSLTTDGFIAMNTSDKEG